jgi:hypothetical protein
MAIHQLRPDRIVEQDDQTDHSAREERDRSAKQQMRS